MSKKQRESNFTKAYNKIFSAPFIYNSGEKIKLSVTDKLIYCYLLSLQTTGAAKDEQGKAYAYPSLISLCTLYCLTKPTVIKSLNNLQKAGVIEKQQTVGRNNIYYVTTLKELVLCDTTTNLSSFKGSSYDTEEIPF